jgi:hypothetical protein
MLSSVIQNVIMLNVITLNVIMLNLTWPNVIILRVLFCRVKFNMSVIILLSILLSVIMLNVIWHSVIILSDVFQNVIMVLFTTPNVIMFESHLAECHYSLGLFCRAECCYPEIYYVHCHYAEFYMLNAILVRVVI